MKNLPRSLSRHERSTNHIQNQTALKTFGSTNIDLALNEHRILNISIDNALRQGGQTCSMYEPHIV